MVDLIKGVRNYVVGWCGVKNGESVLILAYGSSDPISVHGILLAAMKGTDKMLRLSGASGGPHSSEFFNTRIEYGVRDYSLSKPSDLSTTPTTVNLRLRH